MKKKKIHIVPDRELQIKQKREKTSRKNARRKLFKTNRNKYN